MASLSPDRGAAHHAPRAAGADLPPDPRPGGDSLDGVHAAQMAGGGGGASAELTTAPERDASTGNGEQGFGLKGGAAAYLGPYPILTHRSCAEWGRR